MHLLWISDSPDTPSGFGNVTRFVCAGLARRGYQVSILGWQTRQPFQWNGCRVYPRGTDPMGSDALFAFLVRHRPQVVIALADVWWLPFFQDPHLRRQMDLTGTPWVLYFPIDGNTRDERLPPSWIELLSEVDVPVAMSRYGQRIAQRCGIACEYIPHGVDLEIFSPPEDREQAKARVGAAGKFLVLSDSRNQPRKMLPRLLDAFARFAQGRPDALLHLHTDPVDEFTGSGYYSYDLQADVRHLGIESQVRFTPGFALQPGAGLPLSQLAAYYQAADVHLLASSGEGFGLPTLQAAAAGAVPMAGAYSASRELVEGHGEAIAIEDYSENEFGIRRALIDVEDAARKLARYYHDRALLRERSARSREFALAYGWDHVLEQWERLLRSIGDPQRRFRYKTPHTAARIEQIAPQATPRIPGVSVSVKVVERQAGRLEASITADIRASRADTRLPAWPPPCEIARLRVLRRPGYLCVAPGDEGPFLALKRIFPIAQAWYPLLSSLGPQVHRGQEIRFLPVSTWEEARYDLAQSVLLLNVSGGIPDPVLIDAALYGVPCIGTPMAGPQPLLWPDLVAEDPAAALALARALLTNSARIERLSQQAQAACRRLYAPSEEDSAAWLRRLHTAQVAACAPHPGA